MNSIWASIMLSSIYYKILVLVCYCKYGPSLVFFNVRNNPINTTSIN